MRALFCLCLFLSSTATPALLAAAEREPLRLSRADYLDRVEAIWNGQIIATLLGFPFEHRAASVVPLNDLPLTYRDERVTVGPVDDDWYYEMVAVRGFERHGIAMTVDQLGELWLKYACGSYGSSEQARLNLERGIRGAAAGHPRHNKFWYSIGPQFSGDLWGALAPGLPNAAARMAREFGHLNGYAEGTDGGVFVATMISLAFFERDPRAIVRQAATVLHPESPYRQCLDLVIGLAEAGHGFAEVVDAVEDRWHRVYPATNNAVANGGIVAAGVWFGGGGFWPTVNLVTSAADFTDADCNAANAISVVAAMHGMKALPPRLVAQLGDRIVGASMGRVTFPEPVDERISELARRTAAIGESMVRREGGRVDGGTLVVPAHAVVTQPLERFRLADLMRYWNPDWTLERAGFGGASLGWLRGLCMTALEGDILTTFPRDFVRGCLLRRTVKLGAAPRLSFEAGAEPGRAWQLQVFADNTLLEERVIAGEPEDRHWETITIDLQAFAGKETTLRLYQRVVLRGHTAGNALWRNLRLE